jgi:hypothetical protein
MLGRSPAAGFVVVSRCAQAGATAEEAQTGSSECKKAWVEHAFAALRGTVAFQTLQSRFASNAAPVVRGRPAFSLPDPDLLPELALTSRFVRAVAEMLSTGYDPGILGRNTRNQA